MFDPDSFGWTIATTNFDTESPSIDRICQIPHDFPCSDYPSRILVQWVMRNSAPGGLPTPDEEDRLGEFENLITQAMLPDNTALLVHTHTDSGVRNYVFYARDVEQFMLRLQRMPHPNGRFPIVLHQYEDATWSFYTARRAEIQKA
jgi:hypothetical protein